MDHIYIDQIAYYPSDYFAEITRRELDPYEGRKHFQIPAPVQPREYEIRVRVIDIEQAPFRAWEFMVTQNMSVVVRTRDQDEAIMKYKELSGDTREVPRVDEHQFEKEYAQFYQGGRHGTK